MAQHQHIAIQIRTDDPLVVSIKRKLDKVPYQSTTTEEQNTIVRMPSHIRERNKNFYEPRMVSIGPYHRGRGDLKCMENEKLRYVGKMLCENPDVTLDGYVEMLRKWELAARRCYHESIEMDSNEFVEMLLYDACFIIQLIVNCSFPDSDIISDISWNIPLIKSDLLMLENQIPFFVLQRVFELYSSRDDDTSNSIFPSSDNSMTAGTEFDMKSLSEDSEHEKASLFDCLVEFLQHGTEPFLVPEGDNPYDHLLDFYYQCYMRTQRIPTTPRKKSLIPFKILGPKIKVFPLIFSFKKLTMRRRLAMIKKRKPRMIPCATELQEAGIAFKKAEVESIFSIHFSHGVLRIPYCSIEDARRPRIMNLIAFEQCNGEKHKPLTSYAVFMNCIVNTPRDVLILQQNGIIENKLANENAAADYFNQLRYCSYLDYDEHHLAELFEEVKNYCNSPWQKHRAKLNRDYFSNPWSIIKLIAGIVLLLLTFIQTLFTVMS